MNLSFKDYDTAERQAMASKGEARPDGSYPIKSPKDVENAWRDWNRSGGSAADKAHIIARAKAIGAEDKLPADWKGSASSMPNTQTRKRVAFALSPTATRQEGDYFIRTGKFFEVDRPFTDMNGVEFKLSSAEASELLPLFKGAPLNIEHMPTLFTEKFAGKLGSVRHLWLDGSDVMAEYSLHRDIHNFFEGQPLEVSSEWDIDSHVPVGAALVVNPAVHDAVMLAAFSAVKLSPEIQKHHDLACKQGAECPGNPALFAAERQRIVAMMTPDHLAAVQHIHDHAAEHGASCDVYKSRGMYYKASVLDASTEVVIPPTRSGLAGKGHAMFEKVKAFFAGAGATTAQSEELVTDLTEGIKAELGTNVPAAFAEDPTIKAMLARQAKLERDNEQLAQMSMQRELQFVAAQKDVKFREDCTLVDGMVRQMKMTPAEAVTWKEIAKSSPLAFAEAAKTFEARPRLAQLSGAVGMAPRPGSALPDSGAAPGEKLAALTQVRYAEELKKPKSLRLSFSDCAKEVTAANPELSRIHVASAPSIGGGNNYGGNE